eukprot:scaffold233422_cov45-Prasinocladus_malaysianus.AAC.1
MRKRVYEGERAADASNDLVPSDGIIEGQDLAQPSLPEERDATPAYREDEGGKGQLGDACAALGDCKAQTEDVSEALVAERAVESKGAAMALGDQVVRCGHKQEEEQAASEVLWVVADPIAH